MQFYDLVMLAVMGGAIFLGFWKGFAWQVASLAAIFASYFVARNFHQPVADMIGGDPAWNRFLAMFILFMGTSLLIWLGFGFIKSNIERMHLRGFDRQVGAGLGAVKGAILCTLITLFAVSLLGENTSRSICNSKSGNYIARIISKLEGVVPEEIGKHIDPHIKKFQEKVDQHQNELPLNQQNPNGFQQQPGIFQNPNLTQQGNTAPNERVGQLQPYQGGQGGTQQPIYNGTTRRWEYPNQQYQQPYQQQQPGQQQPYQPQQPGQTNNGSFQLPNVNLPNINLPPAWTDAARDVSREAIQGAAENVLQETWRRAMGGNQ